MTVLDATLEVRRRAFQLDVTLRAEAGEVVAVVGPNGAGKSTLLHALAGLLRIDRGTVRLGGTLVDDAASGVHVPAERRSVGVAFQDGRLFPHLSALENVAFGMRSRRVPRVEARRRAAEWLERVGVGHVAAARAAELSGGESQRVALARALAPDPDLLLIDEPLSAVDAADRGSLRALLRTHLRTGLGGRVLVTHDPVEALVVADRLVVLEGGRVTQAGSPAQVVERPRTEWAAAVAGVNLLRGRLAGGGVDLDGGGHVLAARLPTAREGGPVVVVVHPRSVSLHEARPEGSPRNVWSAVVAAVEPAGDLLRVRLAGPPDLVAEITSAAGHQLGVRPGLSLWAAVKATEVEASPS